MLRYSACLRYKKESLKGEEPPNDRVTPVVPTAGVVPPPPQAVQKLPFFKRKFGRTRITSGGEGTQIDVPVITVEQPSFLGGDFKRQDITQAVKQQGRRLKQGAKSSFRLFKDLII
jgi:hypothetical protein